MQNVQKVNNSGQTIKSNKVGKKTKAASNSPKTSKNKSQFAEIFGQLSSNPQLANVAKVKQTEPSQPETPMSSVKAAQSGEVGVAAINQRPESTKGKAEPRLVANVNAQHAKQLEKIGRSATQLNTDLKDGIAGNKASGMEKSLVARTVREILSDVTSTNMGNGSESEVRATANIMGSQISSVAKSMANTIGENRSVAKSMASSIGENHSVAKSMASSIGENHSVTKSMASTIGENHRVANSLPTKSAAPSEIKIADLMLVNNTGTLEKSASQSTDKKLSSRQETSPSSISFVRIGNDGAVNSKENAKNNDKDAGSGSRGAKTTITKRESTNNGPVIRENGVGEFKVAEFDGVNEEKAMLGKSQADFFVSKMIEQIKIAPSSLEVSLKPEYLGKVNILVQSIDGVIAVNVIAQNSEALNLLNSNLQNIKDSLEQQGIKVQQLEVNLANQEKQGNQSGSSYKGEKPIVQAAESLNAAEYGSILDSEQSSLLSHKLNLLA